MKAQYHCRSLAYKCNAIISHPHQGKSPSREDPEELMPWHFAVKNGGRIPQM